MMKYFVTFLFCFLAGCSGKTLTCNDSNTKKTVLTIIDEQIRKDPWGREVFEKGIVSDFSIANIETIDHDNKLDTYQCRAKFSYYFREKVVTESIDYSLSYLEDVKDTQVLVHNVDKIKGGMIMRLAGF